MNDSSNTYTSPSNNEFMGQMKNQKRTFTTANTNNNSRNNSNDRSLKNMTNQLNNSDNDGSNPIVCNCNEAALLLTVKKDGPNQGRQFYTCANNRACEFFQWLDSNINTNSTYGGNGGGGGGSSSGASNIRNYGSAGVSNTGYSSNSRNINRSISPNDSDSVSCECGLPTIL